MCSFLSNTKIKQGTYEDVSQADIVIITAGAKQKPGESRDGLIDRNKSILKSILGSFQAKKDSVILLVSNPVDILTGLAHELSTLNKNQIIGSGTFLDSMRLRGKLSNIMNVNENAVHAYVIGSHGDTQFVAWSSASVGGATIETSNKETISKEVMRKAYDIIDLKGATFFGIGACVASLCQSVLLDQKSIRPVSVYHPKYECVLSWPCVIGSMGVERVLEMNLNAEEQEKLQKCVTMVKSTIEAHK